MSVVYLDHASLCPLLKPVRDEMESVMALWESGVFPHLAKMQDLSAQVRTAFAAVVGTKPASICIQPNSATAFSILAAGLKWEAGDHVLILDQEFPSVSLPMLHLRRLGVDVELIPYREFVQDPMSIFRYVTPRTRLLTLSFVTYTTGVRHPVGAIGKVCREKGILFAVDGTQGVGVCPLDVEKDCVDFLSVSMYKWMLCPNAFAMCYISPALANRMEQVLVGRLSVQNPYESEIPALNFSTDATRFENGGKNFVILAGAVGAFRYLKETGFEKVAHDALALTQKLTQGLQERGFRLSVPDDPARQSAIVGFTCEHAKEVYDRLTQAGVMSTYRFGWIRLSPHFYQPDIVVPHFFERLDAVFGIRMSVIGH